MTIAIELFFPPPAGDNYYDRNPKNPPPKYKLHPPEPAKETESPNYPFRGGQDPNALYNISYQRTPKSKAAGFGLSTGGIGNISGKITRAELVETFFGYDSSSRSTYRFHLVVTNNKGFAIDKVIDGTENGDYSGAYKMLPITRVDGQPDTAGDPPPTTPGTNSSPGNSLGAPSAAPPSAAPAPAPTAPPPSTAPAPAPKPKPNSPGDAPEPNKYPGPVPAPAPAPGDAPQPNKYPGGVPNPNPYPAPNGEPAPSPGTGVGAPSPSPTPAPAPSSFNSGNKAPAPAPGTSPSIKKNPAPLDAPSPYPDTGFQPDQFSPNPLVDNPLEPKKFAPNPNTGNPEPNAPPKTNPPKTPAPAPTPNDDLFKQIQNLIGPVTIALAGITGLVQPNALRSAANAGTCDAFAPGGCNAPIANNAQAAANNSANSNVLLANLLAFLEALQAYFLIPIKAGVELINTKLGPVMSGLNGIGGFLSRLNKFQGVDRVINLVTTAGVIHNCMMLSTSIGDTLFSTLDNIFAIPTLIKNPDGETVDTKETFTKYLDGMFAGIFGTTEWIAIKNQWKAYSTIYNTGSQVFGNIRDIFDETSQIQEVTRNWVAELGNGLQDEGVIGEANWDVKDPTKQIKGKYFARLQRIAEGLEQVENVAEDLEQITSSARNIVETANEIKENTTAIYKAVDDANKAAKLDRDAKEEGLELPNFSLEDLF